MNWGDSKNFDAPLRYMKKMFDQKKTFLKCVPIKKSDLMNIALFAFGYRITQERNQSPKLTQKKASKKSF